MAPPHPKYRFDGTAGNAHANDAAFRATLTRDGPLIVSDAHMLATLLPSLPVHTVGYKRFDLRRMFYCVVAHMHVADDLKAVRIGWYPLCKIMAGVFRALARAAMPMAPVADEAALRDLIAVWMPQIPVAERTLDRASVYLVDFPTNYVGEITTGFLVGSEPTLSRFAEFVTLLPGLWLPSEHTSAEFVRVSRLMLPPHARMLAVGQPAQADEAVCAFQVRAQTDDSLATTLNMVCMSG